MVESKKRRSLVIAGSVAMMHRANDRMKTEAFMRISVRFFGSAHRKNQGESARGFRPAKPENACVRAAHRNKRLSLYE